MGGWMGELCIDRKVEEIEAVGMRCCGWVVGEIEEEEEACFPSP